MYPPTGQPGQDAVGSFQYSYPGYSLRLTEPLFAFILQKFFPSQIVACKFFEEAGSGEPYCFIMFSHPSVASAALNILNGRKIYDKVYLFFIKKLRINWASTPGAPTAVPMKEPSAVPPLPPDGFAIYVGDFAPELDDRGLYDAFQPFGDIRGARIMRDSDTSMSKGYGFVVYGCQSDAELAISRMNGSLLGTRLIKVSWATRNKSGQAPPPLAYTDVYNQSSETNTTIYAGGLPASMDDHSCRKFFEPFGTLQECKYFPDKHYAFIRFESHEAAATAIIRCNGQMIEGSTIKCWWSKDNTITPMLAAPLSSCSPSG